MAPNMAQIKYRKFKIESLEVSNKKFEDYEFGEIVFDMLNHKIIYQLRNANLFLYSFEFSNLKIFQFSNSPEYHLLLSFNFVNKNGLFFVANSKRVTNFDKVRTESTRNCHKIVEKGNFMVQ